MDNLHEDPNLVVLEGFHALKHAIRFGAVVQSAFTSDKAALLALADDLAPDIKPQIHSLVCEESAEAIRKLMPRAHPTGVIAFAVRPHRPDNLVVLADQPRRAPIVVLDNPRNQGNVGAVIRLAAGFGATGVVTTGDLDPWHRNVVRGSAGLHFATAVERVDPEQLPPGPLFLLDPEGEDIHSVRLPDDALLAFGSERYGISEQLRAMPSRLLSIPMRPAVSSFNLATSVAMTLFHWQSAGSQL